MSVQAPAGDLNIANEDCCIGQGLAVIHSKDSHHSFVHYTVLALHSPLDVLMEMELFLVVSTEMY